MDQERDRVQADLRGLLQGEVLCDDLHVQMYSSDASIFEIRPLGVVRPQGPADVVACVQYAADNQIPIHARGAGTGLAGESLGGGLVLDFAHSMRRILEVTPDRVRVQPGVPLSLLNERLAPLGRCFGPDPANRSVTTVGSAIAVNAAGSHWLKVGSTRQQVERLKVVLANGTEVELGEEELQEPTPGEIPTETSQQLAQRVAALVRNHEGLIAERKPRALVNRSGYQLDDLLSGNRVHLARLLVGAEGTLGLITEATLRVQPLPRHRGVLLLLFDRLELAALAAMEMREWGVSACDLLDRRLLRLACELDVDYEMLLPQPTEALLLVEKEGNSPQEVRDALVRLAQHMRHRRKWAFDTRMALERDDIEFFCKLPQRVVPSLYRLKGSTRPLPFVEDIVVPPDELPGFLVQLQNVLKKHQVTASLFGHVGHGQLHIRPFLDLSDPEHIRRMQHLARDLYQEVLEVGGTVSGEHADGLSRTWFLREQYGALYPVFVQVKRIFDPQNILNPGKIVDEGGQGLTQNLRPVSRATSVLDETADAGDPDAIGHAVGQAVAATGEVPPLFPLELVWSEQELMETARDCNGCGGCRSTAPGERMCPIFRVEPTEETTPRAKANLMRGVLTGRLDSNLLKTDAFKQLADLCVNCHQCRLECPASVDIPRLMTECKAQYVATNGLSRADWFLTRLDRIAAWASLARPLANGLLGSPLGRWLLEKTFGIAQGRKLPRLAARSFLRQAGRRRLTRPSRRSGRKVLYFMDVYANWFDTQLSEAFVAIMEHNGVSVYVHPRQQQSGMAMISVGAVERARRTAALNVQLLADSVRQGYQIVTTEPSAALALSRDYPHLVDDEDAVLVAENTSEACSYLWKLHLAGQLELDLKPINLTVGYHEPCHLRALETGTSGAKLLRLIPGLTVRPLPDACSGMAGTYGMKRQNYLRSLRVGWELISSMRSPSIQVGTTECSCCKLQMSQGTSKQTVHPLKLLAVAYGLLPEAAVLHQTSGKELAAP